MPARHPLHPPLVHAPLGLLTTSVLFDALALLRPEAVWWTLGFWNQALGVTLGLATLATGLWDARTVEPSHPASSALTWHTLLMLSAVGLFGAGLAWRGGPSPPPGLGHFGIPTLDLLAVAGMVGGGWLGGELVYRHGLGRKS